MKLHEHNFKAVIFDMDGVLIDSEPLWKIAMWEEFHKYGSTLSKSDFQRTVGLRIDQVVHYWNTQEQWQIQNEAEVVQAIISRMVQLIQENPQPLPGVAGPMHPLGLGNIVSGNINAQRPRSPWVDVLLRICAFRGVASLWKTSSGSVFERRQRLENLPYGLPRD